MNQLIELDHQLFHLINQSWSSTLLDPIMIFVTTYPVVLPLAILCFIFIFKKFHRKVAMQILLGSILAVGMADPIASHIIKPAFHRQRPPYKLGEENVRLIVKKQSSPSFPSNHSTNMFAVATVGSIFAPPLAPAFFIYAALVAYSRVYVGVHFPIDVTAGAIFGMFMGLLGAWIVRELSRRFGVVSAKR